MHSPCADASSLCLSVQPGYAPASEDADGEAVPAQLLPAWAPSGAMAREDLAELAVQVHAISRHLAFLECMQSRAISRMHSSSPRNPSSPVHLLA